MEIMYVHVIEMNVFLDIWKDSCSSKIQILYIPQSLLPSLNPVSPIP